MGEIFQGKLKQIKVFITQRERMLSGVLSILIFIGWVVFLLGFVFAHGVCCADDANIAMIAKNINGGDLSDFDQPLGPYLPILVPTILLIRVFGPTYWVPGLSVVVLNALLLLLIGLLARKYQRSYRYSLAVFFFFFLNYALMAYHFEQWYALLGEITAGLFLILGGLLFYHDESFLYPFLSAISFSLAFLTKFIAGIGFFAFLVSVIIIWFADLVLRKGSKKVIKGVDILVLVLGFAFPLIIFGLVWKYHFGVVNFQDLLAKLVPYFQEHTLDQILYSFSEINARAGIIQSRFGVPFILLLTMTMIAGVFIFDNKKLRSIHISFFSMILFYSLYWILASVGRARHFVVPLLLIILILVMPFLTGLSKKWIGIYFVFILLMSSLTWNRIFMPIENLGGYFYSPTKKTQALLIASDYLSKNAGGEEILTQQFNMCSDIQFITEDDLNIRTYRGYNDFHPPFWIAINSKFMNQQDPDLNRLLRDCSGLMDYEGYLVGRCE